MSNKSVILIVDDEIQVINSLKRVLKKLDCELMTTTRPEEAMAIIDNSNNKIDVIICDYNMPNIIGWNLGKCL